MYGDDDKSRARLRARVTGRRARIGEKHQAPRAPNSSSPVGFLRVSAPSRRCSSPEYFSIRARRA